MCYQDATWWCLLWYQGARLESTRAAPDQMHSCRTRTDAVCDLRRDCMWASAFFFFFFFVFLFFVFLSIQRSDCDEDEAYDCDEDHLPFLCLCPHIQNNQSFFFVPLFTFHILLSIIFLCTFVHVTLILQLDSCLPTCLAKTVCGVVYCGIWGFIGL